MVMQQPPPWLTEAAFSSAGHIRPCDGYAKECARMRVFTSLGEAAADCLKHRPEEQVLRSQLERRQDALTLAPVLLG